MVLKQAHLDNQRKRGGAGGGGTLRPPPDSLPPGVLLSLIEVPSFGDLTSLFSPARATISIRARAAQNSKAA